MKKGALIFLQLLLVFSWCGLNAQSITPPYSNSFDVQSTGWVHMATSGTMPDAWELGTPTGTYFSTAPTPPNAWVTDLDGPSPISGCTYLRSPAFDLSDTSKTYIIEFMHSVNVSNTSSSNLGVLWDSLPTFGTSTTTLISASTNDYFNWYTSPNYGFKGNVPLRRAAFSLRTLKGKPVVYLYFLFCNSSTVGEGWMIDDFQVLEDDVNFACANATDSILGINRFFTQATVRTKMIMNKRLGGSYQAKHDYYISTDTILDANDTFVHTRTISHSGGVLTPPAVLSTTINLPQNYLNAGTYYILHKIDAANAYAETDETDNIGYMVMQVDSIYSAWNYREDFEDTIDIWGPDPTTGASTWVKGKSLVPHVSGAINSNAWYTSDSLYSEVPIGLTNTKKNLISPYLSQPFSQPNSSICFYYKSRKHTSSTPTSQYKIIHSGATTTYPNLNITNTIPFSRNDKDWDCYCIKYTGSGFIYRKYAFQINYVQAPFPNHYEGNEDFMVDNIYFGPHMPDLMVLAGNEHRHTNTARTQDTIRFKVLNGGTLLITTGNLKWYWSTDNVWDAGDVLINDMALPVLADTSILDTFMIYTKPSQSVGEYYLLYILDKDNVVDEMWETNNTGSLKLYQEPKITAPYYNDFETHVNNWKSYSSRGRDQWVWGPPAGPTFNQAFSGTKAWNTNDTGQVDYGTFMHLYTPVFDLTQMDEPIIELKYRSDVIGGSLDDYAHLNIEYSVDGGNTWQHLGAQNDKHNFWESQVVIRLYYGDYLFTTPQVDNMENYTDPVFSRQQYLNDRDMLGTDKVVLNISHLKQYDNIRFKFNLVNFLDGTSEGFIVDDFGIMEPTYDLSVEETHPISIGPATPHVNLYMFLKNQSTNAVRDYTITYYLSNDTLLDGGDVLVHTETIDWEQRPLWKYVHLSRVPLPATAASYPYLLHKVDAANLYAETNEANNVAAWPIMPIVTQFPYVDSFNTDIISGWTWYKDSVNSLPYYQRMTHIPDVTHNVINYVVPNERMWAIEYSSPYHPLNSLPIYYLESPEFDFSNLTEATMTFDLAAVGAANMEYSIDGGTTWTFLPSPSTNIRQNWYNSTLSTFGQQGWSNTQGQKHVLYDLFDFLGEPQIKFRFKTRSQSVVNGHGIQLDNFKIDAPSDSVDYKFAAALQSVTLDASTDTFGFSYKIVNVGNVGPATNVFSRIWATKDSAGVKVSVLDTVLQEVSLIPNDTVTKTVNLLITGTPDTSLLNLYVHLNHNNAVVEVDYSNNLDSTHVDVTSICAVDNDCVWPGDVNYDGVVNNTDFLYYSVAHGSSSHNRPNPSNTWVAQWARMWPNYFPNGINRKHADCNGDGTVNPGDETAIYLNYNLTHLKQDERLAGTPLELAMDTFYQNTVVLKLSAGNSLEPVDSLYGLSFTISGNQLNQDPIDTMVMLLDNSWLGTPGTNLGGFLTRTGPNVFDVAISRNDQQDQSGFGELATFVITFANDFEDGDTLSFNITSAQAIDHDLNSLDFASTGELLSPIVIADTIIDTTGIGHLTSAAWDLTLVPNPATDKVTIALQGPNGTGTVVKVYDVFGKKIAEAPLSGTYGTLDTRTWAKGIYMVYCYNAQGEGRVKRLVVQ